METIVGVAIKASKIEPERAVRPVGRENIFFIKGAKVTIPINPKTIEGIAAKSSMVDFIISLILGGAISAMYIAEPIPIGTEIITAPKVTKREPKINGNIPKEAGSDIGYQFLPNKKSENLYVLKNEIPSFNKNKKIKITNIMEVTPLRKTNLSIINSFNFFIEFGY